MSKEAVDRGICHDCGRYIGEVSRCPYCEAVTAIAVMRRRMKLIALTLIVIGMGFLYLMSINRNVQSMAIGDIKPIMNHAPVRVVGRVVRRPYISRADGQISYLSLLIDDGTGQLRLSAENDIALRIVDGTNMPSKGDSIDVTGCLSIKGDGTPQLQILTAEHISRVVDL